MNRSTDDDQQNDQQSSNNEGIVEFTFELDESVVSEDIVVDEKTNSSKEYRRLVAEKLNNKTSQVCRNIFN